MKEITKKVRIRKTETIVTMDDGIHCAPKCNHFMLTHCTLSILLNTGGLDPLENDGRGLCLRTELCVDIFGKGVKMPYLEIKKRYRNKRYTIRIMESNNKRCHFWCKYFFPYCDGIDYCLLQKMEVLGATANLLNDAQWRTKFCVKTFGNGETK